MIETNVGSHEIATRLTDGLIETGSIGGSILGLIIRLTDSSIETTLGLTAGTIETATGSTVGSIDGSCGTGLTDDSTGTATGLLAGSTNGSYDVVGSDPSGETSLRFRPLLCWLSDRSLQHSFVHTDTFISNYAQHHTEANLGVCEGIVEFDRG